MFNPESNWFHRGHLAYDSKQILELRNNINNMKMELYFEILKFVSNNLKVKTLIVADQCSKRALVFELVVHPWNKFFLWSKHLDMVPEDPYKKFRAHFHVLVWYF